MVEVAYSSTLEYHVPDTRHDMSVCTSHLVSLCSVRVQPVLSTAVVRAYTEAFRQNPTCASCTLVHSGTYNMCTCRDAGARKLSSTSVRTSSIFQQHNHPSIYDMIGHTNDHARPPHYPPRWLVAPWRCPKDRHDGQASLFQKRGTVHSAGVVSGVHRPYIFDFFSPVFGSSGLTALF